MAVQRRSRQRGLSFFGLVFVGSLLAMAGVIAAQIAPTVAEYRAVQKAAEKAAQGNSVAEVRTIFEKACAVDNITSITEKDIEVGKEGDKVVVNFAYQREIHLTGPAYLTLKYAGRSK